MSTWLTLSLRKPNRATEFGGSTVTMSWENVWHSSVHRCYHWVCSCSKTSHGCCVGRGAIIHILWGPDEQSRSASTQFSKMVTFQESQITKLRYSTNGSFGIVTHHRTIWKHMRNNAAEWPTNNSQGWQHTNSQLGSRFMKNVDP